MTINCVGTDVNQVEISSLSNVIGQKPVVELLKVNLESYFKSRSYDAENPPSFGPVCLCGPSGVGKSMIARALHAELGNLTLTETNGEMLNQNTQLVSILVAADENTTIFIDEAQAVNPRNQHMLLTTLSERKLYVPKGSSSRARHSIPLANFAFVLACTHEYQLQAALRSRMRVYCRFSHYSIEDLVGIIRQRADALKWKYESDQVLITVAERAKNTPRLALNRNLQMSRNVSVSHDRDCITLEDVQESFRLLGIDELGLDELERSYLRILSETGSAKLNVISSKLELPRQTISSVIESSLLRLGLIEKGKYSERIITDQGRKHLETTAYD